MVLKDVTPADFHLNELFCLSFGQNGNNCDTNESAPPREEDNRTKGESHDNERLSSYETSVKLLRLLPTYQTPYAKLDCLILMRHCMNFSVARYWTTRVPSAPAEAMNDDMKKKVYLPHFLSRFPLTLRALGRALRDAAPYEKPCPSTRRFGDVSVLWLASNNPHLPVLSLFA